MPCSLWEQINAKGRSTLYYEPAESGSRRKNWTQAIWTAPASQPIFWVVWLFIAWPGCQESIEVSGFSIFLSARVLVSKEASSKLSVRMTEVHQRPLKGNEFHTEVETTVVSIWMQLVEWPGLLTLPDRPSNHLPWVPGSFLDVVKIFDFHTSTCIISTHTYLISMHMHKCHVKLCLEFKENQERVSQLLDLK